VSNIDKDLNITLLGGFSRRSPAKANERRPARHSLGKGGGESFSSLLERIFYHGFHAWHGRESRPFLSALSGKSVVKFLRLRFAPPRCLWLNAFLVFTAFVPFPVTAQIQEAWVAHYNNGIPGGTHQAVKMALDPAGNIYVTGFSQDNNGNVYVTGYDTTAAGGTEIVTIKYSPVTLQKRSDGTFILEAQGYPGESFDLQASSDLQSWLDLGTSTADTNGLMQFDDTNAANYPARFYLTNPQ
jgi:hypothetical protein